MTLKISGLFKNNKVISPLQIEILELKNRCLAVDKRMTPIENNLRTLASQYTDCDRCHLVYKDKKRTTWGGVFLCTHCVKELKSKT